MQCAHMIATMNMIIIVDAIERHDGVAAENAMREHINNTFIFKRANGITR